MSDLRPLYRAMAESGENFKGLSILQHRQDVAILIGQHKVKSILDFGCGRGDAYFVPNEIHKTWGVDRPTLYDPAFQSHDTMPMQGHRFDAVICSDVLEHIPEDQVDALIATLFGYAHKVVWGSVCCRPAKKTFPDGSNLHVTVKPMTWWKERFAAHAGSTPWVLVETQ